MSNCSWTSCREGCTPDYFECHHVKVKYQVLQDIVTMRSEDKISPGSSWHTAALYVNVKGCGYPPAVQCDKWLEQFGNNNSIIPCYYSRTDHSLAITHLDTNKARKDVILSLLIPLVIIILAGGALFILHKGNFKYFENHKIIER